MPSHHAKRDRGLVVIGVFKLFKATLLLVVALGVLQLVRHDVADTLARWVAVLRVDPNNRLVHRAVARVLGIDHRHLQEIDAGTFLYAAVFVTEGIGLLRGKRWAEYLTVAITLSFVPVEVFELVEHPSAAKAVTVALNVAIAAYLVRQLKKDQTSKSSSL